MIPNFVYWKRRRMKIIDKVEIPIITILYTEKGELKNVIVP